MEYQTIKTDAIILKEKEIGEADKIFTLYSQAFGKFEVMGKGIRKTKAKLKFGFQGLNNISLEFVRGKNFFIATDVFLKNGFWPLKKEIKKYRAGLYVCNIVDRLISGEEKDKKIWELLFETLEKINQLEKLSYQLSITVRYFEWNLLSFLGFEPELYHCLICQKKLSEGRFYFSAKEGGIVCEKCNAKISQSKNIEISRDAIKVLRLIVLREKKIINRLRINKDQERELKNLSKYYLSWVLEEEIFVL